jgi:hypothetical protein
MKPRVSAVAAGFVIVAAVIVAATLLRAPPALHPGGQALEVIQVDGLDIR